MTSFGARWLRLILAALVAASTAGCFGELYGTPGMEIANRTARPVDVIYRHSDGVRDVEDAVVRIGPNQQVTIIGLHQRERPCVSGTLIARTRDQVVAMIAQPCEGTLWEVTELQGSSPPPE